MAKHQRAHEIDLILRIVERAWPLLREAGWDNQEMVILKLAVCHIGPCPLLLQMMLDGREIDLIHDVCGIARHLNTRSQRLENGFLPRYAAVHRTVPA